MSDRQDKSEHERVVDMALLTSETRLGRIEEKIDKLSDAMISLARTEEKIFSIEENHKNHYERLNRLSEKIDAVDKKVEDNARTVKLINWGIGIIFIGLISGLVKLFLGVSI